MVGKTVVIFFSELISKTTVCGELRLQFPSSLLLESQNAHDKHVLLSVFVADMKECYLDLVENSR